MEYNENLEEVGESQQIEQRVDRLEEYFEIIRKQISVIKIDDEPYDFIEDFVKTYLNYDMIDMLETREIYADPKLSQEDHEDLHTFVSQLNDMFNTYWGIYLQEEDIFLVKALYETMYRRFSDYFIYFVNGLQKLDIDYVEDLPNYKEYTFAYFMDKIKHITKEQVQKNEALKVPLISEYLKYILELGIKPELYFQIALMESEGDVYLSNLYIETVNDRVSYDSEFFNLKIQKLLQCIESDIIVTQLTEFI